MTTSNFDDRLSGFYDGELSPEETAELQAFLSQSPSAKQTLEDFANLTGLLRDLHKSEQNSIHQGLRTGSTDFYDQLMQRVTGLSTATAIAGEGQPIGDISPSSKAMPADLVNPPSLASVASNESVVTASKSARSGWRRMVFACCAAAVSAIAVGPFALFWMGRDERHVADRVPNATAFGRDRAFKIVAAENAPSAGHRASRRDDTLLAMRTSDARSAASPDNYALDQAARTLSAAANNEEQLNRPKSPRPPLDHRLADGSVENEMAASEEFEKFGSLHATPLAGSAGEITVDAIADQQTEMQFNKLVTAQAYFSLNSRYGSIDASGNVSKNLTNFGYRNSSDVAGLEQRTIPTLCCEVLDEHHGLQVVQLTLSEVGAGNTSQEFVDSNAARGVVAMADSEHEVSSENRQELARGGAGADDAVSETSDVQANDLAKTVPAFKPGSDNDSPADPTVAAAEKFDNSPANGLTDGEGSGAGIRSETDSNFNSMKNTPPVSGFAEAKSTDDASENRGSEYGILVTTDAATLKRFLRSLNRRKDVVLNTDVGNVTLSELPEATQSLVLANTAQQNSTFFNLTNGGNLDQLAEQLADAPVSTNTLMMASAAPVAGIPVSNSAMDFGPPGAGGLPGAGASKGVGHSSPSGGLPGTRIAGEPGADVAAAGAEKMDSNSALKSEGDAGRRGASASDSKRIAAAAENGVSNLPALGKNVESELPPKSLTEVPASDKSDFSDDGQPVATGDSTLLSQEHGKAWGDDADNGVKTTQSGTDPLATPVDDAADMPDGKSAGDTAGTPGGSEPGKANRLGQAGSEAATKSDSLTGAQSRSKPAAPADPRGLEVGPDPMPEANPAEEKVVEETESMVGRENRDSAQRLKEQNESDRLGMKRDRGGEKVDAPNVLRRNANVPTTTNGREVVRSNVERPGLAVDPSKKQYTRGYQKQDSTNRYMTNRAGNTSQNYYVNIPPTLGEQVIAQNRVTGLGVNKDGVLNKDGSVNNDPADAKSYTKLATEVNTALAQPATVGAMYNWAAQIPAQQLINLPQDEQMPVQLLIVFERPASAPSNGIQPGESSHETQPPEVPPPQQ